MTVGIYGIFDSDTDECLYVGLSRTIESRWKGHVGCLRRGTHTQSGFSLWFKEKDCNIHCLTFKILEECEPEDKVLNRLEFKWTLFYKPRFAGKIPSENEKWTHTEETKKRISNSLTRTSGRLIDRDLLCLSCNEIFHSARRYSLYCSSDCSSLNDKLRELEKHNEEIIELYNFGLSLREIAYEIDFDVSHVTLRRYMLSIGVELRGHGVMPSTFTPSIKTLWKKSCVVCKNDFEAKREHIKCCSRKCSSFLGRANQLGETVESLLERLNEKTSI